MELGEASTGVHCCKALTGMEWTTVGYWLGFIRDLPGCALVIDQGGRGGVGRRFCVYSALVDLGEPKSLYIQTNI